MLEREDDSDAPEELTSAQGIEQDEDVRKVQIANKTRVAREGKERRRKWAQRKTPKPSAGKESVDVARTEPLNEADHRGLLPNDIVNLIAAREKQVFLSDSEEENIEKKPMPKKKKLKSSGTEPVILKDIPAPECLQNSLEFLKKRKMQVTRSSSVLKNSNQALRLLSRCGL